MGILHTSMQAVVLCKGQATIIFGMPSNNFLRSSFRSGWTPFLHSYLTTKRNKIGRRKCGFVSGAKFVHKCSAIKKEVNGTPYCDRIGDPCNRWVIAQFAHHHPKLIFIFWHEFFGSLRIETHIWTFRIQKGKLHSQKGSFSFLKAYIVPSHPRLYELWI